MMALVPGLFVYSYFFMGGERTYIGTIGAVTLTIVLLNYNDVDTAIIRVFNIILGIFGSMLMMRFFYPNYARDQVIATLANFLDEFCLIIEDYLNPSNSLASIKERYIAHDHQILDYVTSFKRLVTESKMETKNTPEFVSHNLAALNYIRHIFRLLGVFVFYVTTEDIRENTTINTRLHTILLDLRRMQRMLKQVTFVEKKPAKSKCKENIKLAKTAEANKQFIETMLSNMDKEILLLEDEIKKILLSYSYYSGKTSKDVENVLCE